jgi:hypothetical protein
LWNAALHLLNHNFNSPVNTNYTAMLASLQAAILRSLSISLVLLTASIVFSPSSLADVKTGSSPALVEKVPADYLTQAHNRAAKKQAAEAESSLASYAATLPGQSPADQDVIVAGELLALAQIARNEAQFDTAQDLSRRALARLEKADRDLSPTDSGRRLGVAEIRAQVAEIHAPDPGFRAKAQAQLAEKRAVMAQQKAAKEAAK